MSREESQTYGLRKPQSEYLKQIPQKAVPNVYSGH